MTENKTSALRRRRSLMVFKGTVLWREESRRHPGKASESEGMSTMMGKKGVT